MYFISGFECSEAWARVRLKTPDLGKGEGLVLDGGCVQDNVVWLLGQSGRHWEDKLYGCK